MTWFQIRWIAACVAVFCLGVVHLFNGYGWGHWWMSWLFVAMQSACGAWLVLRSPS